jgi:hypothetical protein
MIRDKNLKEMLDAGAARVIPGSEDLVITHGMEDYPFPQQVIDDLESGALKIPDNYMGVLGVVLPSLPVEGKTIPMGQSIGLSLLCETPDRPASEAQEMVLPMILLTLCNILANTLNQASAMPWLAQEAGLILLKKVAEGCDEVSGTFAMMQAQHPEFRGEPSPEETVN